MKKLLCFSKQKKINHLTVQLSMHTAKCNKKTKSFLKYQEHLNSSLDIKKIFKYTSL